MADISFDQMPAAVDKLLRENAEIKALLRRVVEKGLAGESKEIMNASEAAKFIGRPISAVYALVNKRAIPFSKPDSNLVFLRDDLIEWIRSCRQNTVSEEVEHVRRNVLAKNANRK